MHLEYFRQFPLHLFQLHHTGGIHGESALIGGIAGLSIWATYNQKSKHAGENAPFTASAQSFEYLLALYTPAILCVAAGAWWACMQAGCAWGRDVILADSRFQWFLTEGPDLYHNIVPRYPVQLIGVIWASVTATLGVVRPHQISLSTSALILYCTGAAALTLLRGDTVPTIGQIRIDTVQNIGIALTLGWIRWWRGSHLRLKLSDITRTYGYQYNRKHRSNECD